MVQISLTELSDAITKFKSALARRNKDSTKDMWDGNNSLLKEWFCGKEMNFGDQSKPDVRSILFDEVIAIFKAALPSQTGDIIKSMWNGNSRLKEWFSGKEVNFGTKDASDIRTISLDEALVIFKSALSSHCKDVIKAMWDENSQLRAWFSGEVVVFTTANESDVRTISFDEAITNFKSALSSENGDIIKAMWNGNAELRAWFSGEEMNFGTEYAEDLRSISLIEVAAHFKSALASRCTDVIKGMWDGNSWLKEWLSGKEVNFHLSS